MINIIIGDISTANIPVKQLWFDYGDRTRISVEGNLIVRAGDIPLLTAAAGAEGCGGTTAHGGYDADGVYSIDYGLD